MNAVSAATPARKILSHVNAAWQELRDNFPLEIKRVCRRWKVAPSTVRQVILAVAPFASYDHADAYPTQERIAESLELTTSTVRQAMHAAHDLEQMETLEGDDAWAIMKDDPKAQDRRRHAYFFPTLARAWGVRRRSPKKDERTAWQKTCARRGYRQQTRKAWRDLERAAGLRKVYSRKKGQHFLGTPEWVGEAVKPPEKPKQGGPRGGQPVHLAAAAAPSVVMRQLPPMIGEQQAAVQPVRATATRSWSEIAASASARLSEKAERGGGPPTSAPPR